MPCGELTTLASCPLQRARRRHVARCGGVVGAQTTAHARASKAKAARQLVRAGGGGCTSRAESSVGGMAGGRRVGVAAGRRPLANTQLHRAQQREATALDFLLEWPPGVGPLLSVSCCCVSSHIGRSKTPGLDVERAFCPSVQRTNCCAGTVPVCPRAWQKNRYVFFDFLFFLR